MGRGVGGGRGSGREEGEGWRGGRWGGRERNNHLAVIKDATGALHIMQTSHSHFAVTEVEEIYIDSNGLRISAPATCSGLDK